MANGGVEQNLHAVRRLLQQLQRRAKIPALTYLPYAARFGAPSSRA
jgi:hypothetical protein